VPGLAEAIQHFGPWLLVLNRVLGLFLFTPLFASGAVPMRFRALLAGGFAAAVYGFLPPALHRMPDATIAEHALMMFSEILIGAAIGFIAGLPLIALEMAGHLMGHQMALSLAQSYNPELDAEMNVVGSLLFYLGISAFVLTGGPETVLMILAATFERIPIGGLSASAAPVDLVVSVLTAGTELALRVSAPVVGLILALLLAMGFIMRTMPQVNVLSVGFAIKIMGGLALLMFGLFAVNAAFTGHLDQTLTALGTWVRGVAPAGGG